GQCSETWFYPPRRNLIGDEPLAKRHDIVRRIAELAVEGDHLGICGAHRQVYLGAAPLREDFLDAPHERRPVAAPAVLRVHREVIHRAAMAVIAGHDGGNDDARLRADEEKLALHAELAPDVLVRIVPGSGQLAAFPKRDDRRLVGRMERPDFHYLPPLAI